MKTAVIYARYSSDSQTEQSIEGQLRVCYDYAKNNNIRVLGEYIDRAMTGTNDLRPNFQQMIRDSSKRQWEMVLVYKLDRFSRDKYENAMHKHTLKTNGVKVLSASESIPDTPEGIILESMLEGYAQYYSVELSQKVLRGLNESYIKGNFTGGNQIYGYDVVNKKNIINEQESEIVKEIFTKYAQGFTAVSIAEDFKKRNIRTKKGVLINDKKIYKMIDNPKYNDKTTHRGILYENIYPAIIDDKLWNKVQEIKNKNKHFPGNKKDKFNYVLSGKLVCGYCHRTLVGESGKVRNQKAQYFYYSCLTKRRTHNHCDLKPKTKKILEDKVFNFTTNFLSTTDNIKMLTNSILKYHEKANKDNTQLKLLEARKASALKASQNIISAIEQGIITDQTKDRLKQLEAEITQLGFEIELEKHKTYTYLTNENIEAYLSSLLNDDIENIEFRKYLVKLFIREVIIYNDKAVVTYNFIEPPPTRKKVLDNINEVIEMVDESQPYNLQLKSPNKFASSPPQRLHAKYLLQNKYFVFFLHDC